MQMLSRPFGALHVVDQGPADGLAVVFANSLGTDLRLWEPVLPLLPARLRLIRYDKRGHGLSDLGAPFTIADLADDAIALIEAHGTGPVVFVGLSIGGLIGQAVAAKRPDLLRGLVLSNTAARIGTPAVWEARIEAVREGGLAAIADAVLERWFAPAFHAAPDFSLWRNMLLRTPAEGYAAACAAIAGADLTAEAPRLRLPVLAIAGDADAATPPDLVEATARSIPGAAFALVRGAAHLPCVEAPDAFATLLNAFLRDLAHGRP
jgi:3-oxoadipate enol-lactonase